MRAKTFSTGVTLVIEECYSCGMTFAMPDNFQRACLEQRETKSFFCPNGHRQHYVGISYDNQIQQLKNRIEQEKLSKKAIKDQLEASERSKRSLKGANTRIKNRIKNGVCIICNRSFSDLKDHMSEKHPHFMESDE